ncbi:MAG: glycosyltransferase, partial [Desulfobacterium sp.]|nr:glycosyltransferase [Desulfobacterium sp.]
MKKKKKNKSTIAAVKHSKKPLISVCLIAKNEEKYIDQCLSSVKKIADEIIFVDTGSTDKTVEI